MPSEKMPNGGEIDLEKELGPKITPEENSALKAKNESDYKAKETKLTGGAENVKLTSYTYQGRPVLQYEGNDLRTGEWMTYLIPREDGTYFAVYEEGDGSGSTNFYQLELKDGKISTKRVSKAEKGKYDAINGLKKFN